MNPILHKLKEMATKFFLPPEPDVPEKKVNLIAVSVLSEREKEQLIPFLKRNQKETDIEYHLLTASYSLQFPDKLRKNTDDDSDETHDEIDEELMADPENASDYWLDSDAIIQSLSFLNIEKILEELKESRPFITVVSFKEEIIKVYQKEYQSNDCWAEPKFVEEYLERFFMNIQEGYLNIGTENKYKIVKNQFNQLVIEKQDQITKDTVIDLGKTFVAEFPEEVDGYAYSFGNGVHFLHILMKSDKKIDYSKLQINSNIKIDFIYGKAEMQ